MSRVPRARFRALLRYRALLLVAALVALTAQFGLSGPASAASVRYVALGDSYSAGVGADGYDVAAGVCLRGSHAYPVLWAAAHSPASFAFPACGSATTDVVRSTQLGVLNSATSLVTITVGGNDVDFVNVVLACKVGSTSVCANAVAKAKTQATTVLPAKLAATYADIRAKAPNARLVVLGYPRLFETTSCGLFSMSVTNRKALNQGADVLETVIQAQAKAAGATYVSVNARFAGHRVCAAQPWINGTVALVVNSYHPNASGYSRAYLPALTAVTG